MFAYCGNNPTNMADPSGCFYIPVREIGNEICEQIIKMFALFQDNYAHNSKMDSDQDTTTKNQIINDQNGATGENFRYGNYKASWNACETIAVHNAKVLLGIDSTLSDTMLDFQLNGAMIGDGYFGSNPYAIGKVLDHYDITYSYVTLPEMTQEGIYIISYWNAGMPFNGLHTVAVTYDGTTYTTYNYSGHGEPFSGNPAQYAVRYICGYYLGG